MKYKTVDTPKIDNILKIYFNKFSILLSIFGVSVVLYLSKYSVVPVISCFDEIHLIGFYFVT